MKFLTRLAINRGLLGGNRFFMSLAMAIGLFRLLQRLSGHGPKTLYTHKLIDGEAVVIANPKR